MAQTKGGLYLAVGKVRLWMIIMMITVSLLQISFGFGTNAGLGPSCLGPTEKKPLSTVFRTRKDPNTSEFIVAVKYMGWIVLTSDVVFLGCSIYFLYRIFHVSFKF